jgi:hypothetical protein
MKKISWKNYSTKLAIIFLVALAVGCGTRKTYQTKELDKLKSAEINTSADFSIFKKLHINNTFDRSFKYTRQIGDLKETFEQNNKSTTSVKIIDSVRYKTFDIYRTTITYKSVKNKQTQSNNNLIWIVAIILIFLFALIKFK